MAEINAPNNPTDGPRAKGPPSAPRRRKRSNDEPRTESDSPSTPHRRKRSRRPYLMERATISEPLRDPDQRERMGYPPRETEPVPVMLELNLDHPEGLEGAKTRLLMLWRQAFGDRPPPEETSPSYCTAVLTISELKMLISNDKMHTRNLMERAIVYAWPDFPIYPHIYRSVATIKADAVRRAFAATGKGINWAVLDSGIDETHPHFGKYNTLSGEVAKLHRDFTALPVTQDPANALTDRFGHGTHVAGIIAGSIGDPDGRNVRVVEHTRDEGDMAHEFLQDQVLDEDMLASLTGVAPQCKLISLKVLDDIGAGKTSRVVEALQYVNRVNGGGRRIRIHGVNLSLGYEFDPKWTACGQSPICIEVNRLVKSGVVVVVSAGNTGYGSLTSWQRFTSGALGMTINDPGNASLAITVGATHRDSPYTYGVSYFSSKGPTADGRLKPELVAPGEHITSCAAGRALEEAWGANKPEAVVATYIDDSGTSMAAPHVSGAIAAFLSARREFIGQPEEVKQLFLRTASPLGRLQYFEGHGLIDVMRAIQAV